jgi:hypothetical protein
MYDYLLGGHDWYRADQAEAEQVLAVVPQLRDLARSNRAFILRAVRWMAREGIDQFVDLGSGIPTEPSVHSAARDVRPGAHVAYVDRSAMAVRQARAMLRSKAPHITVVSADLLDIRRVLSDIHLNTVIDFRRPAGVILGAVLHVTDAATAARTAAAYARAVVPGSCLAISAARVRDPGTAGKAAALLTAATWHNHSEEQIGRFFGGLEVVPPGLADVRLWRPGRPEPVGDRAAYIYGGVGRVRLRRRRRGGGRGGQRQRRDIPGHRHVDAPRLDHDVTGAARTAPGHCHDQHGRLPGCQGARADAQGHPEAGGGPGDGAAACRDGDQAAGAAADRQGGR